MLNGARSQERSKWMCRSGCGGSVKRVWSSIRRNERINKLLNEGRLPTCSCLVLAENREGDRVSSRDDFRVYRSLSKIPVGATLSTNPASEQVAAD